MATHRPLIQRVGAGFIETCRRKKQDLRWILPGITRLCQCSHSIGKRRNIYCPESWGAAKFLMQISEHPTDRFAGLAAIDLLFHSRGDGFGIAVVVVAATPNLPHRAGQHPLSAIKIAFRESPLGWQAHGGVRSQGLAVIPGF